MTEKFKEGFKRPIYKNRFVSVDVESYDRQHCINLARKLYYETDFKLKLDYEGRDTDKVLKLFDRLRVISKAYQTGDHMITVRRELAEMETLRVYDFLSVSDAVFIIKSLIEGDAIFDYSITQDL